MIKKVRRRPFFCSLFTRSYLVISSVDDKDDVINFHAPLVMAWSEPMMFSETKWSLSWRKVFKGLWRSKNEEGSLTTTLAGKLVIWNRRSTKDFSFFKTRWCRLRFIWRKFSLNFSELFYFKGQCSFSSVSGSLKCNIVNQKCSLRISNGSINRNTVSYKTSV